MLMYVKRDEAGNIIATKPIGRGRPPKGFVREDVEVKPEVSVSTDIK